MLKTCFSFLLLAFIFAFKVNASSTSDSITLKKIEKLFSISKGKYDSISYRNFHLILSESKKIEALTYEMESYKSLAWFHGSSHNKRRLDSVLFYFYKFESKILELKKSNYPDVVGGHYLNKGNILANRFGLTEIGLQAYNESYKYLDKNNINHKIIHHVYISHVYMAKNQHKKALEFLVPFIKDTGLLPYSYKMFYLRNLATCYMDVSNTSKGIEINNILLKIAKEKKDNYEVWWAKEQLSYNYYLQGNIKRAVDTSLIVRNYLKSNPNIEAALNNSYHLGLYYRDLGDLKKAIFYTEESIAGEFENNESFVNKDLSIKYNVLASIYLKKRDYKKVDYYYKKVKEVRDSIRSREKLLFSTFIITNNNLFEETQKNQEIVYSNTILEEKNTKQWLFIVILVIALVVFLLIIFTGYLLNKNKKGAIKVKKLKASEKKLLEEQIQLKNNELEATASLLSKRVAILNQLKKQLKATNFSAEEKVINTSKIITQLINNASDMNGLTNKISSRYASLTILLKEQHPDLSPRDIDYCLLTKLDLSIKETATILNVSPGTVKVARSRLKTRMNIPPEVSFKEYLNSIIE